mmetsp:Transcript_46433/g.107173  ORF Transcript_46433/g.107173 Transcript_46433/m.107173 type:complete len:287 (+) Transcript_46433:3-863(+)
MNASEFIANCLLPNQPALLSADCTGTAAWGASQGWRADGGISPVNFAALRAFADELGDPRVPVEFEEQDSAASGYGERWRSKQRLLAYLEQWEQWAIVGLRDHDQGLAFAATTSASSMLARAAAGRPSTTTCCAPTRGRRTWPAQSCGCYSRPGWRACWTTAAATSSPTRARSSTTGTPQKWLHGSRWHTAARSWSSSSQARSCLSRPAGITRCTTSTTASASTTIGHPASASRTSGDSSPRARAPSAPSSTTSRQTQGPSSLLKPRTSSRRSARSYCARKIQTWT